MNGDGPLVEVSIDGAPRYRVVLSQRLWEHVRFPGAEQMPEVGLLHAPEDGAPFRVLVRVSMSPDLYVDLGDHEVRWLAFENPYPRLYAYPAIGLQLCERIKPPTHSALADIDFEQGDLW